MKDKRILAAAAAAAAGLAALLAWRLLSRGEFLYAGTVEATEVDISARVHSVIAEFGAKEGRDVRAGELLLRLACEDAALAADIAEKDFRRARQLQGGPLSQEAYDRLKHKRDEAALKLGWCEVKAPQASTVLYTYHEPGELVSPGTKLLTLADLSEVWAMVYVPQPLLAKLSLDMPVEGLVPEMGDRRFAGRVSRINDEAEFTPKNVQTREERTRLVYGVKVSFPNPGRSLKPGMTIEVRLP